LKQTGLKFHANYNVRVFNFLFLAVENKCGGIYGFYFNGLQDTFLEQFTKDAHACCVQDRKKSLGYKHLCNMSIFSFSMFLLIKQLIVCTFLLDDHMTLEILKIGVNFD
jgi:hypothetical protein